MKLDSIGKNIRKFRVDRKVRQEDLAEMTNLSTAYIGMVERGEKTPSLETFLAIVNALNISADMVLYEVLSTGYDIKTSLINDKIESLPTNDKKLIYDVIEAIISNKWKKISPQSSYVHYGTD